MFIWFGFLISCITLSTFVDINKHRYYLAFLSYVSTFFLVFVFSGFRDGLGTDYANYVSVLTYPESINFTEPGYYSIVEISRYFDSNLLFFLFFSFFTNYLILKFYFKTSRSFSICILVYLLVPILYFNTFNLVRQFLAVGLFLFSLQYVQRGEFNKFLLLMIVGAIFHKSCLMIAPFYFILRLNISRFYFAVIVSLSFLVGTIIKPDIINFIGEDIPFYSIYLNGDRDENYSAGFLSILLNIICLAVICKWNSLKLKEIEVVVFKVYVIGVILFNFIPTLYFTFRISYYFLIVLPVVVSFFYIGKPTSKLTYYFLFILFFSLFFSTFLIKNAENKTVIPEKIRSINDF